MSLIKRAECKSGVKVSEALWECPECGHRDVGGASSAKTCSKCGKTMIMASYSTPDCDAAEE